MPSAAELDLYVQCDGGSGDAKEDSLVAKNLGLILDVPSRQVMSFIRTRDRSSVRKLRTVLQDMPQTEWGTSSAGGGISVRTPSDRSKGLESLKEINNKKLQAGLQDMLLSTAYNRHYPGSQVGGPPSKPAVAFDGIIQKAYKADFDRWREQAPDGQVRLLAETCRSLKFFNSSKLAASSYHATYKPFPGHVAKIPPDKDNARNASNVPLGSIYGISEREAQNSTMMQMEHAQRLASAVKRQDDWIRGTMKSDHTVAFGGSVLPVPATSSILRTIRSVPDRNTRSFSRDSWHNEVHNHNEVARHEHRFVTPGEKDWGMCGLTGHTISDSLYELRNPKIFPEGGSPSRQKLIAAKMARFSGDNVHRSRSEGSISR